MTTDEFDAQVQRLGMGSVMESIQWRRVAWCSQVQGYLLLDFMGALYVLDADNVPSATRHGPFDTFEEAYAMHILLGSCRAGN